MKIVKREVNQLISLGSVFHISKTRFYIWSSHFGGMINRSNLKTWLCLLLMPTSAWKNHQTTNWQPKVAGKLQELSWVSGWNLASGWLEHSEDLRREKQNPMLTVRAEPTGQWNIQSVVNEGNVPQKREDIKLTFSVNSVKCFSALIMDALKSIIFKICEFVVKMWCINSN